MTGAKFRRSGFVVWSCLWTAGGLAGGARPCICAQAGTMERNFAQALVLSRPATLRRGLSERGPESLTPAGMDRFPFQHRSGSAFWWLPFICIRSLPHSSPYRPDPRGPRPRVHIRRYGASSSAERQGPQCLCSCAYLAECPADGRPASRPAQGSLRQRSFRSAASAGFVGPRSVYRRPADACRYALMRAFPMIGMAIDHRDSD
jgi:hypothetical protein